MSYYWLGENIDTIPEEIKSYITNTFDIHDCNNDFSVLTLKNVNLVFFCLNNENKVLFDSCIKICENLNKKLITISSDSTAPRKNQRKHILLHTDISTCTNGKALTEKLKKLLTDEINDNLLTFDTFNKHISIKSGSRIDIYQVINFIDDHLDKDIREEDLAKICNYSIPYFSKIFHKVVGMSFRDYVISKKIKKAKTLLIENPQEKLASISYQCGYNDVSYFSRIFKKKTGLTPGEYRKNR